MCLYPKLLPNPKYKVNKKNGGNVPTPTDPRVLWVPVGCQKCIECKKQKARQWSVRLQEEIRTDKTAHFVTLTFNTESLIRLSEEINKETPTEGYTLDNAIATLAIRRFLERWRKKKKRSVKHWLITELGHGTTEHVHLHGLIWTKEKTEITKIWGYGYTYIGTYVNEQTINYMGKYVMKMDIQHKEYNPKILTSAGIGNNYTNRLDAKLNKYKEGETRETYTTRQGKKINMPVYWRNKIYTEEEREKLWIEKLDKQERYVLGQKINMKNGPEKYYKQLELAQAKNKRLGYGNDEKDWKQIEYENKRRKLIHEQREISAQKESLPNAKRERLPA